MAYLTRKDPQGKTRKIGQRGHDKRATFVSLIKDKRHSDSDYRCLVESQTEGVLAQVLDLDPQVRLIDPQPFTMELASGRIFMTEEEIQAFKAENKRLKVKVRFYTPDFKLVLSDGTIWIIEVKPIGWAAHDPEAVEKIARARALLLAQGYNFLVVEVFFRTDLAWVQNIKDLHSRSFQTGIHINSLHPEYSDLIGRREEIQMFSKSLCDSGRPILYADVCSALSLTPIQMRWAISMGLFDTDLWCEKILMTSFVRGRSNFDSNPFSIWMDGTVGTMQ